MNILKIGLKSLLIFFLIYFYYFKLNFQDEDFDISLIKIAYYCNSIKNGGVERVISLLINYLSKEKMFLHYLITKKEMSEEEYPIPNSTRRISLAQKRTSLFEIIDKKHIDILIYNLYDKREIIKLNKLKKTKIIYYDHSCFLFWIYEKVYNFEDTIYYYYKKCKYVISLIPLENDYLFKKWGINSILMDNPSTYEYDSVIPSDLINKNIIMIGRSDDSLKRFDLGIKAMKTIIKEIPKSKMNILSFADDKNKKLIFDLNLTNYVKFEGYKKNIEKYLRNTSLHIMPSISETYPMVLSETKIFGIPSILCGLDYLVLSNDGTIIIYDDESETIAKEAIKILKNDEYRKKLGKEARKSMEKHKNELIAKRWVKLILSIYNQDEKSFTELKISDNLHKINEKQANLIFLNQLKLLQRRNPLFQKVTLDNLKNYYFKNIS